MSKSKEFDELNEKYWEEYQRILGREIDRSSYEIAKLQLATKGRKKLPNTPDTPCKEIIEFPEALQAYSYVLENNSSAKEALEYVAEFFGKEDGWIDEVKNNRYPSAKDVVKSHDDHPVQKDMKKKDTMDRNSLTQASTPNMQLNKLSKYRTIYQRLDSLEDSDADKQKRITLLEAKQIIWEEDISRAHSGTGALALPDKVSLLKTAGYTDAVCAEVLDVSERTVRRHKKTLELVQEAKE